MTTTTTEIINNHWIMRNLGLTVDQVSDREALAITTQLLRADRAFDVVANGGHVAPLRAELDVLKIKVALANVTFDI